MGIRRFRSWRIEALTAFRRWAPKRFAVRPPLLQVLHASAAAFEAGELSYSKIRTLTRVATFENEAELVDLAKSVSAADLGRAIAAWLQRSSDPDALENYHRMRRSIKWRNDPDGMVNINLRLPPLLAGMFIAIITSLVMRSKPRRQVDGSWPTLAQQHADALEELLSDGAGTVNTEIVLHVRGDGTAMDDGTPVPASVVERVADTAAIRAMIHDAEGKPINVSGTHRHPTTRQKRVVKERDQACVDCGRRELLTFDHVPEFETSRRTVVDKLELRCAPCHWKRHPSGNN